MQGTVFKEQVSLNLKAVAKDGFVLAHGWGTWEVVGKTDIFVTGKDVAVQVVASGVIDRIDVEDEDGHRVFSLGTRTTSGFPPPSGMNVLIYNKNVQLGDTIHFNGLKFTRGALDAR